MPGEEKEQLNVFKSGKTFGAPETKEKEKEKKKLPPVLLNGGRSGAGWLGRLFSAPMSWMGRFFSSVFGFGGLERMLGVRAAGTVLGQRVLALLGLLLSTAVMVLLGVVLAGADSFLADFGLKLPGNMGFWAQDMQRSRFTAKLNASGEVEDEDWLARRGKRSGRFGAGSGSGFRDEFQPDVRMKGGTGAGDSIALLAQRNSGQLGDMGRFSTGGSGVVNLAGPGVVQKNDAAMPAVLKVNPAAIITPLLKNGSQPGRRSASGVGFGDARLGAIGSLGRTGRIGMPGSSGGSATGGGPGTLGNSDVYDGGETSVTTSGSLGTDGGLGVDGSLGSDGALTFPTIAPSGSLSGPCSDVACVAVPETALDADLDVTPASQTKDPVGQKALEQIEGMVAKCSQINTDTIESIAVGMDDCWDGTKTEGGTVGISVPSLDKVADTSGIQAALDDMNLTVTSPETEGTAEDDIYTNSLAENIRNVEELAWEGVKAIAASVLAKLTPDSDDDKAAEEWMQKVQKEMIRVGEFMKNSLGQTQLGDTVIQFADIVGSATEDGFWGRIGDLIQALVQYFKVLLETP